MRATFVTLRRLHALAAHGHPPAEYREGHIGAERFHQLLALDRATAVTSLTAEFDNRLTIILQSQITQPVWSGHVKKFPIQPSN
ncbi:hypothetical protein HER20_22820 [Rhizobium sp. BUS002]|uniref:Uncharacterized protein n=1 Tax=Rhizobium phaseoli TaxID=396 RepID=A0A7X6F7A3_9HYPH|nr:hypothetical protein RPHASCH2410_PD04100 [Rhizobium phaseoli Ch24-10]NKF13332.1 hypothetical protein [Rhizobium phaseoli]QPK12529.1 hypothetical protein HER27_031530 [Rhizobium phaseoli]